MSEEEIIELINKYILGEDIVLITSKKECEELGSAIQGLLDLYTKEKEKNKELDNKFRYAVPDDIVAENYVSKDKIKDKIKELDMQQKQFREDRKNKHTDKEILYTISVLESLLEIEVLEDLLEE